MNADDYTVVFNVAAEPYDTWWFAASGLIFVAVGIGIVVLGERRHIKILGALLALLAVLWSIVSFVGTRQQYDRLQTALREGRFSDVEGWVEDFVYHWETDTFRIGPHRFEVHTPVVTSAYNQTKLRGGANLANKCARVLFTARNEIVWLAIRKRGCEPRDVPLPSRYAKEEEVGRWDP